MTSFPLPKTAGIFWIERENWISYVSSCADRAKLPSTYEAWLVLVEQVINRLTREGWEVSKIDVNLDEFAAWCRLNAVDGDRIARIRYADGVATGQRMARNQ